jgi:oxygen-independent coproporphyrinogen III oxidase
MTTSKLISKYNRTGPRYTSYPTALLLEPVKDQQTVEQTLSWAAKSRKDISLYIHLPFCRSLCWYCGCNKVISRNSKDADTYLDYLQKDFERTRKFIPSRHSVTQVHLGGGTPTFLSPEQLMRLKLMMEEYFNLDPAAECSVEMDPRYLSKAQIQVLRGIGFNRASIGVQDLNEEVQKAIHRIQPYDLNKQVVKWLREAEFTSINMDLIYGLPEQNLTRFADTLQKVVAMKPERLAIYNYAHLPDMFPSQRLIDESKLPDAAEKIEMLTYTIDYLRSAGYVYIGMDHFALPTDELSVALQDGTLQRNFQGYSTRSGTETWAFGASAISQIGPFMTQRHKLLEDYYKALDENRIPIQKSYLLNSDDLLRRDVIMKLMCGLQLKWEELDETYQIFSTEYFSEEIDALSELEADGLVICGEKGIVVTEKGRLFLRNIAMVFDAYLPKNASKGSYSKTI